MKKLTSLLQEQKPEHKTGMVLGGGGAKGCYHVGAWQALKELGLSVQGISGTSIGALVGSFAVYGDIESVTDFTLNMEPTEIAEELPYLPGNLKETVRGSKAVLEFILKYYDTKMDITPLKNHFDEMFNYDEFEKSPVTFACMTLNETTNEPHPFYKKDFTKDNSRDLIMASAACYPAFPKVEIDGQIYIDGGYADNVPIALNQEILPEADARLVIDIHDPAEPQAPGLDESCVYLQPLLHPGHSLDFSRPHAMKLYNQGYLETMKQAEKFSGWLFTFNGDDYDLQQILEAYLARQFEQNKIVLPDADRVQSDVFSALLGYSPRDLDNRFSENYSYGRMIEALAIMARIEPVALYDYRSFLGMLMENLGGMSLTATDDKDYRIVELFSNLKKDELCIQLFKQLKKNQGHLPNALEKLKSGMTISYMLAYVWYFLDLFMAQLSPAQEK